MQFNIQKNLRIFNTPKNLNLELLFPDFNGRDLPKIEFLIHQINLFGSDGYQVNCHKHSESLSISTSMVSKILKTLIDHKIIYISSPHIQGQKSATYKMVQPFDINNEKESRKNVHRINEHLFLQRLQADNWIVVGKAKSKFVKQTKSGKVKTTKSSINIASHDAGNEDDYIKQLETENAELKYELAVLRKKLEKLNPSNAEREDDLEAVDINSVVNVKSVLDRYIILDE